MKILHGSIRSQVSVSVTSITFPVPRDAVKTESVEGHGLYQRHGDSTFSVDPDGTLYIYGDRRTAAHHTYEPDKWLWVGDECDNTVFNTLMEQPD